MGWSRRPQLACILRVSGRQFQQNEACSSEDALFGGVDLGFGPGRSANENECALIADIPTRLPTRNQEMAARGPK